jgi:hypothetical protein
MCGGGAPKQPTVDPEAERQKAADEAAAKANMQLVMDSRRRRGQRGLLGSEDGASGTVLARAMTPDSGSVLRKALQGSK